jgi:integrase
MKSDLPRCVYKKHGAYYLVKNNQWTRLSSIKAGFPEMYRALSEIGSKDILSDSMPTLITDWLKNIAITHSEKTQYDDAYRCREVSRAFVEFRAKDVRPPDVIEFLNAFKEKKRTYNAYRSLIKELMRYAEEKGFREPESNPVSSIKTKSIKARDRYISDSELRRIKVWAMYGRDGKRTRSGFMMCALIDMAYLTGQRIGDLLKMEWSQIKTDGIEFEPSKLRGSTGVKILIEWTPRLSGLIDRLRAQDKLHFKYVFCKLNHQPLTYGGANTNWDRAVKRAGVKNCHFHDLRAKAITDVDKSRGIGEAQSMGAHSTQSQTADYIRHKTAKKTAATR